MANVALISKFNNRFARFDRENQCIVLEFKDGSEGQIEKSEGEYLLDLGEKQIEGEKNICTVVNELIRAGYIVNLGIANF